MKEVIKMCSFKFVAIFLITFSSWQFCESVPIEISAKEGEVDHQFLALTVSIEFKDQNELESGSSESGEDSNELIDDNEKDKFVLIKGCGVFYGKCNSMSDFNMVLSSTARCKLVSMPKNPPMACYRAFYPTLITNNRI